MKKLSKNWILTLTYIMALAVTLLAPLLSPPMQVKAAIPFPNKFEFVNGATIHVEMNGQVNSGGNLIDVKISADFVDGNPWDDKLLFEFKGECGSSNIELDSRTGNTGKLKIDVKNQYNQGKCHTAFNKESITIESPTRNQLYFNWVDKQNIVTIDGKVKLGLVAGSTKSFKGSTGDNLLHNIGRDNAKCEFTLILTKGNTNADVGLTCSSNTIGKPGGSASYKDVSIGNDTAAGAEPGTGGTGTGGGTDIAGDARPSCETTQGNPLSWGLCPLINGAAATADWVLEDFIVPFLDSVPISLDRTGDNAGIFEAWSAFRILANIMLVGVLLFIVIAESTGGGE